MGLRRSLRMRRELSAAYEFTRSVRFSYGKISLCQLFHTVGAIQGFAPQALDLEHDGAFSFRV